MDSHLKIKIFAYDARFWYICGKFAYAIRKYNEINDEVKNKMKISEICIFLHKRCMKHGGEYAKHGRRIGNHLDVLPEYITEYMEYLDTYYQGRFINEQFLTSIYFNLESIHPLSDGNGRIEKALIAISNRKLVRNIKTKKHHKMLCKYLSKLQQTYGVFEDKINNKIYFENMKILLFL